jgi:hypothetical protein
MTARAAASLPSARHLLGAVALQYGYQVCAASLLALPLLTAVSASHISSFPEPDRTLLDDGGVVLLEVLRSQQSLLSASAGLGLCLLACFALAALLPDWWVLKACSSAKPKADARRTLGRLGLLAVLSWSVRALLWVLALSLAFLVRSWLARVTDDRSADLLLAGGVVLGLGLQLGTSLLHDLISASVVSDRASLRVALVRALGVARGQARRLWVRYLACRLGQLTLLVASSGLLSALDAGDSAASSSAHAGLRLLTHQTALQLGSALRVLWLWYAARSLESAPAPRHAEAFV